MLVGDNTNKGETKLPTFSTRRKTHLKLSRLPCMVFVVHPDIYFIKLNNDEKVNFINAGIAGWLC